MHIAQAKAGYTPREFCQHTSIGMTKLYELKNAGKVRFVKVGSRTIITEDPAAFLAKLATYKVGDAPES